MKFRHRLPYLPPFSQPLAAAPSSCADPGRSRCRIRPSASKYSPANPAPGWYSKLVKLDFVEKQAVLPKIDGVCWWTLGPQRASMTLATSRRPSTFQTPVSTSSHRPCCLRIRPRCWCFIAKGYDCMLSHNSAHKAEKLGYTNVRVFAEGFPGWMAGGNLHCRQRSARQETDG
jgi:hypothetical protein